MNDPAPSEVAALRRIKFFEELTDADLSRLARIGQRRSYAAGDAIVEKGSDRGGFFVLLSGVAEVEAGGTSLVLSPGDFFGETALLAGSRRTATVRATGRSKRWCSSRSTSARSLSRTRAWRSLSSKCSLTG